VGIYRTPTALWRAHISAKAWLSDRVTPISTISRRVNRPSGFFGCPFKIGRGFLCCEIPTYEHGSSALSRHRDPMRTSFCPALVLLSRTLLGGRGGWGKHRPQSVTSLLESGVCIGHTRLPNGSWALCGTGCVCVCVCACGPTERRTPCGRCPDEQIPPTPSTPRAGPVGIHSPTRTKSQKVHDTHTLNLSVSVASHSSGMAQLGLRAAVAACVLQLASAAAPICNISAVEEEKRICEG
jgi:hypothetical protein